MDLSRKCHWVPITIILWRNGVFYLLLSVHQNTLCDRLVCPSARFHDNSWTRRRRMMKHGTITLEVKSNMEFEGGSRTWPLTRLIWGFVLVNACIYVLLQFISPSYHSHSSFFMYDYGVNQASVTPLSSVWSSSDLLGLSPMNHIITHPSVNNIWV